MTCADDSAILFRNQDRLIAGETAYIDPRYRTRSVGERKITEAIDRCFMFEPDDRADISEIIEKLREGLQEALHDEEASSFAQDTRIGRLGRMAKTLKSASLGADDKLPR